MEGKNILEGKRCFKDKASRNCLVEEGMDAEEDEEVVDEERKRRVLGRRGPSSGGASPRSCQVESCGADLSEAKQYHRRHKVCEVHAKAPAVIVAGLRQRFCQQCSRFHELSEFDEAKRSCRRRLAGHNERRRKSSGETSGEASGRKQVSSQFTQPHERSGTHMTGNPSFKRSQIR